jgi:hypothetical protein
LNGFFLSSRAIAVNIPILCPDLAALPLMARSLPIHESAAHRGHARKDAWRQSALDAEQEGIAFVLHARGAGGALHQPVHDVALKKGSAATNSGFVGSPITAHSPRRQTSRASGKQGGEAVPRRPNFPDFPLT